MNKKSIIMSIIVILSVIAIILLIILMKKSYVEVEGEVYKRGYAPEGNQINTKVHKLTNSEDFYAVSNCVNKYLTYLSIDLTGNEVIVEDEKYVSDNFATAMGIRTQEDKNKAIYDMLDTTFIKNNRITTANLYNFINSREGNIAFEAEKINILEGDVVDTYSVYGRIYNVDTLQTLEYAYYIVSVDKYKITFMIEPLKNTYKNLDEVVLENRVDQIEENNTNGVQYENITDYDLALKHFTHYQLNAIYNTEKAYEYIDKEYREKKFGSFEAYKIYVDNNKEIIANSVLESYQVKEDGETTRYICLDQNGNYYIFNETAVMEYTVILDTYTIDLPEFTDRYNSATEQQKVALNIDRFMQAINAKDYKYAYSCLADSYKNNYFKTQEEFEIYAKENFYANSTVQYKEFNLESNVYTYSVMLTDKTTGEQKNKTFVMQLGKGTEFVLSFDK